MIKQAIAAGIVAAAAVLGGTTPDAYAAPLPECDSALMAVCDGPTFPDGSFWHYVNGFSGWRGVCTTAKGVLVPPPAPPGSCGGAV